MKLSGRTCRLWVMALCVVLMMSCAQVALAGCAHKNSYSAGTRYSYTYGNEFKDNKDGKTHSIVCDVTRKYGCQDCGASWEKDPVKETVAFNHSYVNDVCQNCGAVNTCAHKDSYSAGTHYSYTYGNEFKDNKDGKTHSIVCDVTRKYGCRDCGTNWEKDSVKETVTFNHSYVNDVCQNCGAVNTCTHKDSYSAGTRYSYTYGNEFKDNKDGKTHSIVCDVTRKYGCRDCGTNWEKDPVKETVAFNHSYVNDVCQNCGWKNIPDGATLLTITTEPKNVTASDGETVKFTVKAEGDGLKYQWYYQNADSKTWKEASSKSASYSLKMEENRNGRKFYCEITDAYGVVARTKTVTMKRPVVKITKQPSNAWAYDGEKAKISLTATGDGLKYQWYYRTSSTGSWKEASGTKSSYSLTMDEKRDGRQMKCIVTDQYGKTAESDVVKLSTRFKAKITKQPSNAKAVIGEKAKTSVTATGDGLTYQWYYKNPGSSSFKKSSIVKASCSVEMTKDRDGRQMYCIVTDKYGNTAKSNTITLSVKKLAKITTEPKSVTVSADKTAKFTVKAEGDGLKYQWYYQNANSKTWKKASSTSASYSLKNSVDRNGRKFYCEITDAYGTKVKTKEVTMKLPVVKITSEPKSVTMAKDKTAKFTVKATGDGLKYQWYYSTDSGKTWKKASSTSATYSLKATKDRNGRRFYCKITDAYGTSVKTEKVKLTVK